MIIVSIPRINILLTFFCLCGLGVSLYAYTVELQLEKNDKYSPVCDISPQISCSKAFKSQYGKGLGIFDNRSTLHQPNSLFGIMFYSMLATLALSNRKFTTIFSAIGVCVSNLLSLYFAYILLFVLYDFCIVCVGIYVINLINFLLIYLKIQAICNCEDDLSNICKKIQ